MRTTICLFLLIALAGIAWADEDPAPPAKPDAPAEGEKPAEEQPMRRGLVDGTFYDDYFGIVFKAKDLTKGWSMGGPTVVFSGRCEDSIDVEISILEGPKELTPQEFMDGAKKAWEGGEQKPTEMEQGTEPTPWVLFVQESMAGFKKHHGYSFRTRGLQGFLVHATIREKTETSGEALKRVIQGLEVSKTSESYLVAHLIAKQSNDSPTDPHIMLQAGGTYVSHPQLKNPVLGLRLLRHLKKTTKEGTFSTDNYWGLLQSMGLAQLLVGERKESIETWKEAIAQAAKTSDPAAQESNARYNLACAYSLLGQLDEAFAELEKSLAVDHTGQLGTHAQTDPDLEAMRKDERWKKVVSEKEAPGPMD